ncbi:CIA30 family protein [Algoriphagus namhaensis]|uniref:CIA30 family protein n=1 Tax=Algoriphagus namhaensis TaxID=915353 RepID=A0ABV8ANY6_9BACT
MKTLLLLTLMLSPLVLVDFSNDPETSRWYIVDDGVMGGRSQGNFSITKKGVAVFEGTVSLENNGGFSSLRYRLPKTQEITQKSAKLYLKGDGKNYQFRIKRSSRDYHSYIFDFQTSGEWEEVIVPLEKMYPAFRGRNLAMEDYPADQIEEITFLIGNKKPESFRLEISKIELF